jgi:L-alanine-DL-glutamate epimerase-like enolase superfamily enzyme
MVRAFDSNIMKAKKIRIYVKEVDLGGQVFNPRIVWKRKQAVFIEVENSNGIVGWGECWTFDQSADALVRFLQTEIIPAVIDREFSSIESMWQEIWSNTVLSGRHGMTAAALSGLDNALWDILAQEKGVSLGEAISPDKDMRPVPVYASGGLYRKDGCIKELQKEMRHYVRDGFRCVKMKIGALEFKQDLERVRAAREAIGDETNLIVDAVYSLDRVMAERWLPEWEALNIQAVQAPFRAQEWDAMQWLNRDCGMPVMVFEAENRFEIFRALLKNEAVGILQFSPIAVGGVSASCRLIRLAESFGCPVSMQCSSSWVAEMIALQIARANASVRHVEIHTLHRMLFECAEREHLQLKNGCLHIGSAPGLGFVPPYSGLTAFDAGLPDME